MVKLNDVDIYLLDKWDDVAKFQEAVKSLNNKLKLFITGELTKKLKEQDWWSEEFAVDPVLASGDFCVYKKLWKFGEGTWNSILLGLWGIKELNRLLGMEEKPQAYIYIGSLKENDREKLKEMIKKDVDQICKTLKINNAPTKKILLLFELSQTSTEWIEIIKSGSYVEEILKYFNILAKFIDPIDRAIAKLNLKGKK